MLKTASFHKDILVDFHDRLKFNEKLPGFVTLQVIIEKLLEEFGAVRLAAIFGIINDVFLSC